MRRWTLAVLCYGITAGYCAGYLVTEEPLVTVKKLGLIADLAWDNLNLRHELATVTSERDELRAENHDLDCHNTAVESERAELRLAFREQMVENIILTARLARLESAVTAASSWCQTEVTYRAASPWLLVLDGRILDPGPPWSLTPSPFPEPARIRPAYPE